MADSEDVQLRDLVVEALEKNGSLAKVRALLRANVFMAFDEELEQRKQNINLDRVLEIPEGILSLSLIHEFLDYCNLRNTLFVYNSETRHGKEYKYHGRKDLAEKFANLKTELGHEPLLVSIIKSLVKAQLIQNNKDKKVYNQNSKNDDQNCTYIVHGDTSSASSNSMTQSDSSDEKNKLLLRLPLDNSDTDTSSDSTRGKTSSEYIANKNLIIDVDSDDNSKVSNTPSPYTKEQNNANATFQKPDTINPYISSDSTSYLEIQNLNKQISIYNTVDMNKNDPSAKLESKLQEVNSNNEKVIDAVKCSKNDLNSLPEIPVPSMNKQETSLEIVNNVKLNDNKNDTSPNKPDVPSEYSYDFSISSVSSKIDIGNNSNDVNSLSNSRNKNIGSPRQESNSSRSSISLSDVSELIENNEIYSPIAKHLLKEDLAYKSQNKDKIEVTPKVGSLGSSTGSNSFSVSSVSNLSLDYHSE